MNRKNKFLYGVGFRLAYIKSKNKLTKKQKLIRIYILNKKINFIITNQLDMSLKNKLINPHEKLNRFFNKKNKFYMGLGFDLHI